MTASEDLVVAEGWAELILGAQIDQHRPRSAEPRRGKGGPDHPGVARDGDDYVGLSQSPLQGRLRPGLDDDEPFSFGPTPRVVVGLGHSDLHRDSTQAMGDAAPDLAEAEDDHRPAFQRLVRAKLPPGADEPFPRAEESLDALGPAVVGTDDRTGDVLVVDHPRPRYLRRPAGDVPTAEDGADVEKPIGGPRRLIHVEDGDGVTLEVVQDRSLGRAGGRPAQKDVGGAAPQSLAT